MTWKHFLEDDRKIKFLDSSLPLLRVRYKGDEDIQTVRVYRVMKSISKRPKLMDLMTLLFNQYKPPIEPEFLEDAKGNPITLPVDSNGRCAKVRDYTRCYRKGEAFFFVRTDGSTYICDIEWHMLGALLKKRKTRRELRSMLVHSSSERL